MAKLAVTGTKGVIDLLRTVGHRGLDAKSAVEAGVLHAQKVEGVWVYSTDEGAVALARETMAQALEEVCSEWLLVQAPIATAGARKRVAKVAIDHTIAQALVREQIGARAIGSLPLLTDDFIPYFALYSLADQDEIDRFLATLRAWASDGGEYCPDDLPSPRRKRTIEAWRERVLLHGEFLGLGHFEDGNYVAHWVGT
jgi:hypothetical protein